MDLTKEIKNESVIIGIDNQFTIYEAASIKDEIIDCFENYNDLSIDFKRLEGFDITGIQILYSALISAKQSGKKFKLLNMPYIAINLMIDAGLDPVKIFDYSQI
ncbi:MAG: hypothetical protein HQK76_05345 [Desulfobacterales bacterium]|nr:hypothetical protein [Desulfobacterales bacterium]